MIAAVSSGLGRLAKLVDGLHCSLISNEFFDLAR